MTDEQKSQYSCETCDKKDTCKYYNVNWAQMIMGCASHSAINPLPPGQDAATWNCYIQGQRNLAASKERKRVLDELITWHKFEIERMVKKCETRIVFCSPIFISQHKSAIEKCKSFRRKEGL